MAKKIFFVDDEKDLIWISRKLLEKEGFEVIDALKGADVLPKMIAQKPDLVILDLLLPDKDGDQLCHEIKSHPQLKDTPVIISTGQIIEDVESSTNPHLIPPDAYLKKPYEFETLLKIISSLLNIS